MPEDRVVSIPSQRSVETSVRGHETFVEGFCDGDYFQMSFEKRSDGKMYVHFYALTEGGEVVAPARRRE